MFGSRKRYRLARPSGSSAGPPRSCGSAPGSLRGTSSPVVSIVIRPGSASVDRPGEGAADLDLEVRPQAAEGEGRIEEDVERVVEGVVEALDEPEHRVEAVAAAGVGARPGAGQLAIRPQGPAVDEEVELVEERGDVPVRPSPGHRGTAPARPRSRLATRRSGPGPRRPSATPRRRLSPAPACSAGATVAPTRTRRSGCPRRSRSGASASRRVR